MSAKAAFEQRVRAVCAGSLPLPGSGRTPLRHALLFDIAEENLSLAKIAEAHFDALAILDEAGESPVEGAVYAVWASEAPGTRLRLVQNSSNAELNGDKPFCSGGSLVDRALVTVDSPERLLVEVDLRASATSVHFQTSSWTVEAFRLTETGPVSFLHAPAVGVLGPPEFYLTRPGFWHGACGPAACWAGGAAGLLGFARQSSRDDAHTVAHRAAMESNVWAMKALLAEAGREIDEAPGDTVRAQIRALRLRHLIEQLATDTLQRFARAYGPYPLAMHAATARRYEEANLFLRQCHGERDLEALGRLQAAKTGQIRD